MKKYLILLITILFVVNQTSCFDMPYSDDIEGLEEAGVVNILNPDELLKFLPEEGFTSSYPGAGAGAPASTTATEFDGNLGTTTNIGGGGSGIHNPDDLHQAVTAALIANENQKRPRPRTTTSGRKVPRSTPRSTKTRTKTRKRTTGHFANIGKKAPRSKRLGVTNVRSCNDARGATSSTVTAPTSASMTSAAVAAGSGAGVGRSAAQIATEAGKKRSAHRETSAKTRPAKRCRITAQTAPVATDKEFTCRWDNCEETFVDQKEFHNHVGNHCKGYRVCLWEGCDKKYDRIEYLKRHINAKHINIKYPCPYCDKIFTQPGNLRRHIGVHNGVNYPCSYPGCKKTFTTEGYLKTHMNKHNGTRYPCPEPDCKQTFADKISIKQHIESIHNGVRYPCLHPNCNKVFSRKDYLNVHMNTHNGIRYLCPDPDCEQTFTEKGSVRRHLKRRHPTKEFDTKYIVLAAAGSGVGVGRSAAQIANKTGKKRPARRAASAKTRPAKRGRITAASVESDDGGDSGGVQNSQTCKLSGCNCKNKTFPTEQEFYRHVNKKVSEQRDGACRWENCDAAYGHKSKLIRHTKEYHTKEKSFKCGICGVAFYRKEGLNRHLDTDMHKVQKAVIYGGSASNTDDNYVNELKTCKLSGCNCENKTFPTEQEFYCHVNKKVSEQRDGACRWENCDAAYGHKSKLIRHTREYHTKERPFKCEICKLAFPRKDNLNKHMRSERHNLLVIAASRINTSN